MTDDRTVLVTGASSGLGFATALHLARHGWRTFAGVRTASKADRVREAAAGLPLEVVALDVTSDESVAAAFARATADAPLDVLVNNAGVAGGGPFEDTTDAEQREMFETNYFGAVRCIRAVLPAMRERGSGAIVNVTSASGLFPWPNQAVYAASKWALEGFGASLAHEVRRFGIRVCHVEPGAIRTEIVEHSKRLTHFDNTSPYLPVMKRNGKLISAGFRTGTTPDDVAVAVLEAVTTDRYRFHWPVGPDAVAFAEGRHRTSVDEFVELGAADVSDDDHAAWFRANLGIEL